MLLHVQELSDYDTDIWRELWVSEVRESLGRVKERERERDGGRKGGEVCLLLERLFIFRERERERDRERCDRYCCLKTETE